MSENNQIPQAQPVQEQSTAAPTLTLDFSKTPAQAELEQASQAAEEAVKNGMQTVSMDLAASAPSAPNAKAEGKVTDVAADLSNSVDLSDVERAAVDSFVTKIDLHNPDHVLLYGAEAQKKIAEFSDSALQSVRTQETGEVGNMLANLVGELQTINESAEEPKGIAKLFFNAKKQLAAMQARFTKVEGNVDNIADQLTNYQVTLLKDVSMFNHMYDMNTQYFRELTMYIIAGEKKLKEVRANELAELLEKARQTGDAMDAQKANDLSAQCDRFEKKLYDLKLTRQVSMQMAPQIRLLQNNNSLLVELIQSTLANTLPLWKSQMVLALGLSHLQEAMRAQRAVTDMTNDLLKKNAETLKMGTIETAKEAERGIIDIETLVTTNQSLIDTFNEVARIQTEGRQKRAQAEQTLISMEGELKKKLLELKH